MRRLAPALALLVCALPARAKVSDEKLGYQLELPSGWTATELAAKSDELVATYTNDTTGQVLIIAKIPGPTDGAWSGEKDFFESVERGVEKQYTDYKRVSHDKKKLGKKKVPAYDLWFRVPRDEGKVVMGARFLFFKGYALSLVVDSPGKKRPSSATKKIVDSFAPLK